MYNLGVMYANGKEVKEVHLASDVVGTNVLLIKVIIEAMLDLGVMYDNGEGVPQDVSKAIMW